IQVKNPEKMRDIAASPPSRYPPTPISISSIQSTAGETASTDRSARKNVDSGFSVPNTAFISRRNRGRFHNVDIVFTQSLLPQPEIPISRSPLGIGIPASSASLEKRDWRFFNQVFSVSYPPTSSSEKRGGTNSRTPSFLDICSFSARISKKAASSKTLRW